MVGGLHATANAASEIAKGNLTIEIKRLSDGQTLAIALESIVAVLQKFRVDLSPTTCVCRSGRVPKLSDRGSTQEPKVSHIFESGMHTGLSGEETPGNSRQSGH